MNKYIVPLFFAGILVASLLVSYILFNKYEKEKEINTLLRSEIEGTKLVLAYELKQWKENDQKIAKFKEDIDKLSAQRDSYRRQMQEAMKKDEKLNSWANDKLPDYVRDSFKRMWLERNPPSPGDSGKERPNHP